MHDDIEMLLDEARVLRREHRLDDARRLLLKALEIARTPNILAALGQAERDLGHIEEALTYYLEAAEDLRMKGPELRYAHTQRHVADIYAQMGNFKGAVHAYLTPVAIYRQNPDASRLDFANALRGLAIAKAKTGEPRDALQLWREAGALYEQAGVEAGVAESRRQIALLSRHSSG